MQDKILHDIKIHYGLTCSEIVPVSGGWLNQKWRVTTEEGDLLIKQFSTRRYSGKKMERIENALKRQMFLEKNGVPCPAVWEREGRILRWLDEDTIYMVMRFLPGITESDRTTTATKMRSLGNACGIMHRAFSKLPEPTEKSLPSGGYSMDELWKHFRSGMAVCPPDVPAGYREALLSMEQVLRRMEPGFFQKFPQGYAHEDMQAGNILFDGEELSAIVDFDRNCYAYIWHDLGRAVMALAFDGVRLDGEKVRAFLEGYSQHYDFTLADMAEALRLTWCIETPWWILPGCFGDCSVIPKRFRDEMLWLTEHWFELDRLLAEGIGSER